jgi:LemA protein
MVLNMKKGMIILVSILAVVAIFSFSLVGLYNGLVAQKENVDSTFSIIDVQLKRRADLIPNLVNTVKGFAAHETEAIKNVTDARAKMTGAGTVADKAKADNELTGALSRLMVIVENYPTLKADANFRQLSDELAGTENRISVARIDYNKIAKDYNVKVKKFPTNIIAGSMGFSLVSYFEANEAEKQTPTVDFGKK